MEKADFMKKKKKKIDGFHHQIIWAENKASFSVSNIILIRLLLSTKKKWHQEREKKRIAVNLNFKTKLIASLFHNNLRDWIGIFEFYKFQLKWAYKIYLRCPYCILVKFKCQCKERWYRYILKECYAQLLLPSTTSQLKKDLNLTPAIMNKCQFWYSIFMGSHSKRIFPGNWWLSLKSNLQSLKLARLVPICILSMNQ